MADKMTSEQRHYCMSRIRSGDTGPERAVRRALFAAGYRFRKNVRSLPGSPDIVLPKYRTVIFVNGCFWHGHEGCSKYTVPKSHVEFWQEKIARNRERDILNTQRLESIAWSVVTVWECELSKSRMPETLGRIEAELKANRAKWEQFSLRRKQDRRFALEQARKRRELAALVEAELAAQLQNPAKLHPNYITDTDY